MIYWLSLLCAGLVEVVGVFMMKKFILTGRKIFILLIASQFTISFILLSFAMRDIPMGTAYAIWTGIGASGGVIVGILLFKESKSFLKLFFISIVISSSIGLKLLG